ncbi:MAG: hypothetical protein V4459_03115 [Pseudomonadota bacterium]
MKKLLIAAGLAASLLMGAPAMAAPVSGTGIAAAPQDSRYDRRDDRRDDRRADRRDDRRGDRRWDDRGDRRGNGWNGNNGRRYGWNGPRCQNVRRHHRWVRVCSRRW